MTRVINPPAPLFVKVIACIGDPLVNKQILTHLRGKGLPLDAAGWHDSRAPPQGDMFS